MTRAVAMDDKDREAWLERVSRRALKAIEEEMEYDVVVVGCSALTRVK